MGLHNLRAVLLMLPSRISHRRKMSDDFERRLTARKERLSPNGPSDALRALAQRIVGPHANVNGFSERLRDYELAILNIRQMGDEIDRRLAKEHLGNLFRGRRQTRQHLPKSTLRSINIYPAR